MKTKENTTYKVYRIKDQKDNVVYVGQTSNPNLRLKQHTTWQSGKFYGECYSIEVVLEFNNKQDALLCESMMQQIYGFDTLSDNAFQTLVSHPDRFEWQSKGGTVSTTVIIEHSCGRTIKGYPASAKHVKSCGCSRESINKETLSALYTL